MSTHKPMTQERIDAIQERADAATAEPWSRWAGLDDRDNSVASDGREDAPTVADSIPEKDDAVFIAHAREDVPALLAEVERLRHFESIVSWRYGDTTDGMTREDMIDRAAEALYLRDFLHRNSWATEDRARVSMAADKADQCRKWTRTREDARAALDAALGTGDER